MRERKFLKRISSIILCAVLVLTMLTPFEWQENALTGTSPHLAI